MNVFYEEEGAFKAGSVLTDNITSFQVESPHGKRSKIKAASVLVKFAEPAPAAFIGQAQQLADEIDLDFLWECCAPEEFGFEDLAADYFGHRPSAVESAGVLICLHRSPMHFYKKGKGRYKPAPEEALQAALASVEKKKRLAEQQAQYVEQLTNYSLPAEFEPLLTSLLYHPDKNSIAFKALESASHASKLSIAHLLEKCGALPSSHDFHLNRFLFEHFPKGLPAIEAIDLAALPELPKGDRVAFSIDDSSTTEIDDAFSVARLENGNWQVGIHIAAPALGISPGSGVDSYAKQMLSTLYIPGQKFTMLPSAAIETFTLIENRDCPVLSLYLEVHPESGEIVATRNALERVEIAANLRHETLEPHFNESSLQQGEHDYPYGKELKVLWDLCARLEAGRGKSQNANQFDFNFSVSDDRVSITQRVRGEPIDKVVSELMIYANSEWGRQLKDSALPAIFRSQQNGKVRHGLGALPHVGLGVTQYAWATSPLRRYVDLVNQRQLISLIDTRFQPQTKDDVLQVMRDFDLVYETWNNFQRTMERYWCLRWLIQEQVTVLDGTVLRENLVRLDRIPLICKVPSLPEIEQNSRVQIEVSEIDLLELSLHAKFSGRL